MYINRAIFWITAAVLVLLRIVLAYYTPVWIDADAPQDDVLMLSYANIFNHFAAWNTLTLAKTMSFPVFLGLLHISGIPYTLAVCIMWIIGALLTLWFFSHFVLNFWGRLAIFAFILFCPVAFDGWTGLRIYRQAIIAPAALIAVMFLFLLVLKIYLCRGGRASLWIIWLAILSGISFFFFFYIKEDGIWLMPLLLILTAVGIYFAVKSKHSRSTAVHLVIFALLPVLIFTGGVVVYKSINNYFFGVYEVNTRTGGEFGKFTGNLIKIEDENKTPEIWIPFSTLEKAWQASDTLGASPKPLEIMRAEEPLPGDLVFWRLKAAFAEAGLYESDKQSEALFRNINHEIAAAFNSGQLGKAQGFAPSSNVPPRTISEIMNLTPIFAEIFRDQAMWNWSEARVYFRDNEWVKSAEKALYLEIPRDWADLTEQDYKFFDINNAIIKAYRMASPFLIILAIAGLAFWVIRRTRPPRGAVQTGRNPSVLMPVFAICIVISCLVLAAGVSWFGEWLWILYHNEGTPHVARTVINYYSSGAAPLIVLLEVMGVSSCLSGVKLLSTRRCHNA